MADNFGVNVKNQPSEKPSPRGETGQESHPSVDESSDSKTAGVVSKKSYGA